jgi:hypothetical protein
MAVALPHALLGKGEEQLRAINAPAQGVALVPSQPHEWHAVRHYQVRCVQNFLEGGIVLRLYDAVHAGGGDRVTRVAPSNPSMHLFDDMLDLHCVDLNP